MDWASAERARAHIFPSADKERRGSALALPRPGLHYLKTLQGFADQNGLHGFKAEFLEILGLLAQLSPTPRSAVEFRVPAHQDRTLEGMLKFANIARPGVLHERCKAEASNPRTGTSVSRCVAREKMHRERRGCLPGVLVMRARESQPC